MDSKYTLSMQPKETEYALETLYCTSNTQGPICCHNNHNACRTDIVATCYVEKKMIRKPLDRYQIEDWHRNNINLGSATAYTNTASCDLRQENLHSSNEISNKTHWDAYDNTVRLDDRLYELKRVEDDLQLTWNHVHCEISELKTLKEFTEREVEARLIPIETALDCLNLRERRREGDLVRDDLEKNLESEMKVLEKSRANLEKLVLEAVQQIRDLDSYRLQLQKFLRMKRHAIEVDDIQRNLSIVSDKISFKPNSCKSPEGSLSPSEWIRLAVDLMKDSETCIVRSKELRDRTSSDIQTCRREDEAQRRSVDFSLRIRSHQEQRARDDLQYQKNLLIDEIRKQEFEVSSLENHLRNSAVPLKVAQTRLENRKVRIDKDLCEDDADEGLRTEVNHLITSRDILRKRIMDAKEMLHSLQAQLQNVDADLTRKKLSVTLEEKVMATRQKIYPKKDERSQTERNLALTGSCRSN